MARLRYTLLATIVVGAVAAMPGASPGQSGTDSPWPEDWLRMDGADTNRWTNRPMGRQQEKRLERHSTFMAAPHIEPYLGRTNPLPATQATIDAGAAVYAEHCLSCHGPAGFGNGDAGLALDPSPALLSFMVQMPRAIDGYLMWSIAEGGGSFASEMPAFKGTLAEHQMWQVIAYMRSGFGLGGN